jgi:putative endonuclease
MFYIYLIYSASSDLYYVGYSDNPLRRLDEHNSSGHTTFSSKHRPWVMSAVFECGASRSEAMKIERFIKRQKSRDFIKKLIKLEEFQGPLAQLVIPYLRDAAAGLIRGSLVLPHLRDQKGEQMKKKPAVMSAFSFTIRGFGGCNVYDRLTNKSINRWLTKYVFFPAL